MTPSDFTAFDLLEGPVIVLEPGGAIVHWNRACSRLAGRRLDEVRGKALWDFFPPDDAARAQEALAGLLSGGRPCGFECAWVAEGGAARTIAFSGSMAPGGPGAAGLLVLAGVDVTERAAAREAGLARLRALLQQAPEGIFIADLEGRYTDVNDAGCRMLGYSREEIVGRSITDLIPPEDAARLWEARELLLKGAVQVAEWGLRRKDGSYVQTEVSAKVLPDGRWQALVRDASERRAHEQERERLMAEVDAERQWLRGMLDIVPMGILFFEPGGRLYANRWTEELLGIRISPSGGSAQYAGQILFPDGRPVPPDQLVSARVLQGGETIIGEEYLVQKPDGTRTPVLGSAAPLRDAAGRIAGGVGVFQDLSERMRAQEAIRVTQERLEVSLRASPVVVWNQDEQLRYTWIHNSREPFTPERVLGRTDFDLLPRPDAEHLSAIKRGVLQSGAGARAVVRAAARGEPRSYDLTIEPLRDARGRVIGITCASWDVTDRLRTEQEQRLLAQVGAVLMTATLDYDATLKELANLGVQNLADWFVVEVVEPEQVRRLRVAHADPARADLARRLEQFPIDRERPYLLRDAIEGRGPLLLAEVTPSQLRELAQGPEHLQLLQQMEVRSLISVPLMARGRLLGAFALLSSRSSRRYDQRDLLLAEALARLAALAVDNAQLHRSAVQAVAARDEVLGIVAHDLRNPLNAVLMQAELLGKRSPEGRAPGESIQRAVRRMDRLIQDMLDVARLEAGALAIERARLAPGALLEEAAEMQRAAAEKAGLHLHLAPPGRLPEVLADHGRVLQVFDNLIGNAIKFTAQGGEIEIGASAGAGEVRFRVSDTGAGIPAEHLAHLFDRFWQANRADRRGAGLGLPIAKGIVEAHGGRLWVESAPGRGTTFHFTLPLAPPAHAPAPARVC